MNTKLKEQVEWLKKLVDGLKTINKDEFRYNAYVSQEEIKDGNICGTVCCAFGWMPRFVPESGVTWQSLFYGNVTKMRTDTFSEIRYLFASFMFGGHALDIFMTNPLEDQFKTFVKDKPVNNNSTFDKMFGDGLSANLEQVINRIEVTIEFLEKNVLYFQEKYGELNH